MSHKSLNYSNPLSIERKYDLRFKDIEDLLTAIAGEQITRKYNSAMRPIIPYITLINPYRHHYEILGGIRKSLEKLGFTVI